MPASSKASSKENEQPIAKVTFRRSQGHLRTMRTGSGAGRTQAVELLANGHSDAIVEKLRALKPEEVACESLSLEEIFIASKALKQSA